VHIPQSYHDYATEQFGGIGSSDYGEIRLNALYSFCGYDFLSKWETHSRFLFIEEKSDFLHRLRRRHSHVVGGLP
jgi:hypothetical protein